MTDLEVMPADGDDNEGENRPVRKDGAPLLPLPQGTLVVHTEFLNLVNAYEDATFHFARIEGTLEEVENGYATLAQRKKELFEWVVKNTPKPRKAYAMVHRF